MAQKHLGATRLLFVVTCALALVAGSSTPSWSKRERTCPTANTPTVTFVNHSGHRAHIKLLGPCRAEISVLNGQERTVSVSGGGYYTMTRLDEDRYLKGGFFTLNRTPKLIQRMRITLLPPTLHPHGNYRLRRISATEFNGRPVKSDVRKRKSKKVRHAVYLSVVTKGAA